ncbi:MAG: nitrous oxide reductase accessory protein NosL [Sulfuritalea sp.]|nr:nitrous oxide reductase accessory protein NosL [Sulfuritalea sp.]
MKRWLSALVFDVLELRWPSPWSGGPSCPNSGAKDLCPVCGMLVSNYPNWVATIPSSKGRSHAHHFDGAKDVFRIWFRPAKYVCQPQCAQDMAAIWA